MTEKRPALVPPRVGAFFCPEKRKNAVTAGFKNFSKTVQKLLTHKGRRCGILTMSAREAATPKLTPYRSFFLFLFFTPFYFVNDRKAPRTRSPASRGDFLSGETEKAVSTGFKNFSKTVQNPFTHKRARCGILIMSKGSNPLLPDGS